MLTVVTGAPGSGKTTYVKTHAEPGDITIDFDHLAQALGSPVSHGHDAHFTRVTLNAWQAAIAEALRQSRRGIHVWIVDTKPTPYRYRAYVRASAVFIKPEWNNNDGITPGTR